MRWANLWGLVGRKSGYPPIVRPVAFDLTWRDASGHAPRVMAWLTNGSAGGTSGSSSAAFRAGLRFLSHHSGIPTLVVVAAALVLGYKLLRKFMRFALQVLLVTAVLGVLAYLGWLRL